MLDLAPIIHSTAARYMLRVGCIEWVDWVRGPSGWVANTVIDGQGYQFKLYDGVDGGELIRQIVEQLPRRAMSQNSPKPETQAQVLPLRMMKKL